MKICTTEQEYINAIAPSVQKVCKRYGYLPSVLIAQSCLENGYGIQDYWDNPQIKKLLNYNNMVGIKSQLLNNSWDEYTVWTGQSFTKKTPEYLNGKNVIISDDFRVYDTIERSFADFLLFITYASNNGKGGSPKYGQKVLSINNPSTLIKKVSSLGYATGTDYSTNVIKIINKHNLTKYDDLSKVDKTIYVPGYKEKSEQKGENMPTNIVKIGNRQINDITARNKYQVPASRGSQYPIFIVVHYLGVPNADNPDLYGGGYGGHFNIKRNGSIYKAADPRIAVVWQCGGGLQGSGGHSFYKICTNYNSIGIECGVAANTTAKDLSGDSGLWYFTEQTQESLVWLVSKLMDEFNIPFDHVIRHYDVTGKICPNPYVKNNNYKTSWTWTQFKNNLKQYRQNGTITNPSIKSTTPVAPSQEEQVPDDELVLMKGQSGFGITEMQTMLIACGYSCGSTGADGKFGNNTQAAVKKFQKDNKLTATGIFDLKTREALTAQYNKKKQPQKKESKATKEKITVSITRNKFVDAVENVQLKAKQNKWKYGNSLTLPPCEDKLISCDRLEAKALYDLGFKDQRKGGQTCGSFSTWLPKHGWTKVTNKKNIKPGAIVAVRYTNHDYIDHVFTIVSYDDKTGICTKYDTGSNQRILSSQPFKNVKLLEWTNRVFVCAWNPPSNMTETETIVGEYDSQAVTFCGINYKSVYDYEYYKKKYSDLQKAFGNDKNLYFKHFCQYGMKEGRIAKKDFNVIKYKEKYEDLRKAFGSNLIEYYKHYCLYGKKEGRKGN